MTPPCSPTQGVALDRTGRTRHGLRSYHWAVTAEIDSEGWLLIGVSTAGAPAALRVHVWRKLRSLGALYVQQSVCLLPARAPVVREVRRLADRVRHQGGTARILQLLLTDADERAGVIGELNDARDDEYTELLGRLPSFGEELATERARGRASYVEVEENEADLERYRTWLGKIAARDYFGAPAGDAARAAVDAAAQELAEFEAEALRVEAPGEPPPATDTAAAPGSDGARARWSERLRSADES